MLLAFCAGPGQVIARSGEPVLQVDPFIGTDGHGHTYPGATVPFGMVQLSPDTRLTGWDGCSGCHFSDEVVYGFSHTHLSGTGVSDYGDILLMPMTGTPRVDNGAERGPDRGYASRFSKSTERAEPGWYAVHLDDYDVDVELTATERTGLHRYVFPEGRPSHVVIDLAHREDWKVYDGPLTIHDSATLQFVALQGDGQSPVVRAQFHRIPNDWQVETGTTPLSQYTAGGDLSLIDGRRGALSWRSGRWQGYQAADVDAVLDLGSVQTLRGAGAGFLQDVRSWIWMPSTLTIDVSTDGETYRRVAELTNTVRADDYESQMQDWVAEFDAVDARWVRVHAESPGPIPQWHPGHGEHRIVFVDELILEFD